MEEAQGMYLHGRQCVATDRGTGMRAALGRHKRDHCVA